MDRDEALRRIKAIEPELRALGVTRLSLFGSVARGEAGPESDLDVLVFVEPPRSLGFDRFFDLKDLLESKVHPKIDLIAAPVSKARLRDAIGRDAVEALS
jgi:uncharacterized protein